MNPVIQKGDPDRIFKLAVIDIVNRWVLANPSGWELFLAGMRESRAGMHDESGMDATGTVAACARIPRQILESIDLLTVPETIERQDGRWKWFRESFPQFFLPRRKAMSLPALSK